MYTFEEIVGNEHIIKNLQSAVSNNKVSHAYIIDGIEGSGKMLLANTFAKTLQCEKGGNTPCNECISCHTFDSGNNPDIIYVVPTKTKALGIEDIRNQMVNILNIKPYKNKYKIFIIDNADTMTVQAQNAILKTIEEPPSYSVFILLSTNFSSFLPTVLSRCILIKLRPLSEEVIKKYIKDNLNVEEEKAGVYSAFALGSIGKAKKLIKSEEFGIKRQKIMEALNAIKKSDDIEIFELAKSFEDYKEEINEALDICFVWYRDLLMLKIFEDKRYIIEQDKYSELNLKAGEFESSQLFKILDIIENTRQRLDKNVNFQLALEIMFLKIKENLNG